MTLKLGHGHTRARASWRSNETQSALGMVESNHLNLRSTGRRCGAHSSPPRLRPGTSWTKPPRGYFKALWFTAALPLMNNLVVMVEQYDRHAKAGRN